MGTIAARKALRSIGNAKHVLTLEVLVNLQALHFRNAETLGEGTGRIHETLLTKFIPYDNGHALHTDLSKFRELLFEGHVAAELAELPALAGVCP